MKNEQSGSREDELNMQDTLERSMGERSPGVYVRDQESAHNAPHELDMLWGNAKSLYKEERSPVLFFILGFLSGALITGVGLYLFMIKPAGLESALNGGESRPATATEQPAKQDNGFLPRINLPGMPGGEAQKSEPANNEAVPAASSPSSASAAGSQEYTVQSGDTLGSIAEKFYGSSAPDMVEKITRANNLKNPNALQLDQKLVIPPKSY